MDRQFGHYFRSVEHLSVIDVYAVLRMYNVTCPAVAHAIKKLLASGQRGAKDRGTDLREAVVSIERAIEMDGEEEKAITQLDFLQDSADDSAKAHASTVRTAVHLIADEAKVTKCACRKCGALAMAVPDTECDCGKNGAWQVAGAVLAGLHAAVAGGSR